MLLENLDAFLVDFGTDAVIGGETVRGIFDNAFGSAFGGMIDGSGPMVRLPSSVLAARGNPVVIASTQYVITSVEPDGTGLTVLRLEQQ